MTIVSGREFLALFLSLLLHSLVVAFMLLEWTPSPVRMEVPVTLRVNLMSLPAAPLPPKIAPPSAADVPPPPAEPAPSLSASPPEPTAVLQEPPLEETAPVIPEPSPPAPAFMPPAAPAAEGPVTDPAAPYVAQIAQRIASYWSRPPDARREMKTELLIQLVPTGEVVGVRVLQGSGHTPFDASAEAAVWRTGGFPEIRGMPRSLFEKHFRNLQLIFRPEDLPR